MALVVYDRVQQTGTANTTVSFTLSGSVTGYQSFAVVGNGNTTYYGAIDASGNWEVGLGTYSTSGPTLTRTTILSSSSSNTAVSTFSGSVNIFVTYPAEDAVYLNASGNVSPLGTITSGAWSATTIAVASGGTGVTTSASNSANSVVLRDANVNITTNNTFNSYTAVTAAGLTTTMTAASSFYQKLAAGSGNQTFKLPDATTLPTGATYIFDNDSTGNLIIQDNAGGAIDTIQPGSLDWIYLEANGTNAGSWGQYAFIPASYDFNTSTASFGNATITNTTWSASTIGTSFGGTGLTTFSSSNYALYSTSPSTLVAGTLPVLAGGTGTTTSTGSGSTVLSSSPNLTTPNLGVATATSISLASSAGTSSNTSNLNLGGTLGFSDTGILANFVSTTNSYNQVVVQNLSSGASASSEFIAYSNAGSASTNFATVGINSTGYTGTGSINGAGYGYFLTGSTDLVIGTIGSNNLHMTTNSQATDAITITPNNAVAFNGSYGSSGYYLQSNGASAAPVWVTAPGSTTLTTTDFTATSGQTTFTVSYTPALLEGVYRNGIKLGQADYTATSGTSIILNTGAITGDLIEVVAFTALSLSTAVTSISFGSTGLTPSTASAGAVTVAGTLAIANGGTGLTSVGTSGYYLQSTGSGLQYAAVSGGSTITATTTNTSYYLVGTSPTTGTLSTASISTTSPIFFNASTGALTAVSHVSSSDERLKQNIETIADALVKVETMRGVTYLRNGVREIGVVAQEVERVVPEVIHTESGEYGYKSVSYGNMVGLLIEAVKELSAEVKELKVKLNDTSE